MTTSFKIPLVDQPENYSKSVKKWFYIAFGIMAIMGSIFYLYQTIYLGEPVDGSTIFNFVILPTSLFIMSLSVKSSYIQIDSNSIQYKTNYFNAKKSIPINKISKIKIDFTDVKIALKSGETHTIDFSAAKHSDISIIKSKLNEIKW